MDLDTNVSPYWVVKFNKENKLPFDEINSFLCVPFRWVMNAPDEQNIKVAYPPSSKYPELEEIITKQAFPPTEWRFYSAELVKKTNSLKDAKELAEVLNLVDNKRKIVDQNSCVKAKKPKIEICNPEDQTTALPSTSLIATQHRTPNTFASIDENMSANDDVTNVGDPENDQEEVNSPLSIARRKIYEVLKSLDDIESSVINTLQPVCIIDENVEENSRDELREATCGYPCLRYANLDTNLIELVPQSRVYVEEIQLHHLGPKTKPQQYAKNLLRAVFSETAILTLYFKQLGKNEIKACIQYMHENCEEGEPPNDYYKILNSAFTNLKTATKKETAKSTNRMV